MTNTFHTAFVTGGSGFVGRNLIKALRAQGIEVRALVRSNTAMETVSSIGAQPIQGDLTNIARLADSMTGCDVVFHVAGQVGDWGRYEDFYQTNVVGTEHILEAAHKASVPRLVHVSTEAVLLGGPAIINADETWKRPAHPLGMYGRTKGLAEERVLNANSPELATMIVRPRFIWGKDDTTVLAQLSQSVRSGSFMWIDGGHYLSSTCHVANVCEGMMLAAERGRGGEIYFLTDGQPVEFRSFITALLQTQGLDAGNRSIPRWVAQLIASISEWAWSTFHLRGAPPLTRATVRVIGEEVTVSDAKARRELGYKNVIAREEGLREMNMYADSTAAKEESLHD